MAGRVLRCVLGAAWAAVAAWAAPVSAQDFGISELRAGAYVTGLELPYFLPYDGHSQFVSLDTLDFEVLFHSPDIDAFGWLGSPRPAIGATISTIGRESLLHAGLVWQYFIGGGPVFAEGSLGLALNNGVAEAAVAPARNLGCNFSFYWTLGVGTKLTDNVSVLAQVYHGSHAGVCGPNNEGLNGAGLKFGYAF